MKYLLGSLFLVLLTFPIQGSIFFLNKPGVDLTSLRTSLAEELASSNKLPDTLYLDEKNYELEYSTEAKLQKYIKRLLSRLGSDFSSVVVIDNNSGEILGLMDFNRKKKKHGFSLSLSATHPSASLFKIIAAAEFIESDSLNSKHKFSFNGKSTTLYKYQLKNKKNKWTRYQSFGRAFARSNNVVFGKAAIQFSSNLDLYKMANKFGFNEPLMDEIPIGNSYVPMAKDQYNLAEIASGFNRKTYMSPIHAALLPLVMVNDGRMVFPRLINSVKEKNGEVVWQSEKKERKIIDEGTAKKVAKLMEGTITHGTASRGFKRMKKKIKRKLSLGGKTGSITGGVPYGKRDWFVAFARPKKSKEDKGISVCIMNVNKKLWRAKSTSLARRIIEYYYSKVSPII